MREKMGALSFSRLCPCCRTVIRITVDEMKFTGVTSVPCPTCGYGVRFTSDLGLVLRDVTPNYEKEFKRYGQDRKKDKRRQAPRND